MQSSLRTRTQTTDPVHSGTTSISSPRRRRPRARRRRWSWPYRGVAMQDLGYELPRIHIPRTWVNRLASWALTNRPTRRISMGDNCIARMPNSRVAPGAGDPHGPSLRGPRGESLELAWPSSSVGLNSFGPNPTANLVGDKERGHSGPSGSVLGEPAPDRAA